ncbi:MAG: ATP-binding protein [Lentisphaeria bacterium]|nr:ATP-binding protein [Lentisphaeria bacterium]
MKDLTFHIFDLVENSVKAGATRLWVDLIMDGRMLTMELRDNGPGFPEAVLKAPADPDSTTRTERPVGLGLALMRESARATGGTLTAANAENGGARVSVTLFPGHIDARPLGDVAACFTDLLAAWPSLDMTVRTGEAAELKTIFDSRTIRQEVSEDECNHPSIRRFIANELTRGFQPLTDWYDSLRDTALTTTTSEV